MTRRHICVPVAYFLLNFSILAAQNWMEMSDPVRPYVTRLTDGNGLSCGLATQEEMVSIREAIDRMPPRTPPSGKYALAPPAVLHQGTVVDRLPVSPQLMILPGLPGGCL